MRVAAPAFTWEAQMPMQWNSGMAGPRFRRRPALLAALIALAIGAAAPPASPAATSAGELYAFGLNGYGELGSPANNGTENPNPTPTLVTLPGASGPVTAIAAGRYHSLVLTASGQLYAFGDNHYGELGSPANNGTENPNPTPTLVTLPGASGPVTQIAAGEHHSLALTASGQLYSFGENDFGQLGNASNVGTKNPNPTPTLVSLPAASGPVTQIGAGAADSLALTASGWLYAFGDNFFGQLGSTTNNGTFNPNPTPTLVSLPGASGPVTQIAAGGGQSFALTSSGRLYAFGFNGFGELGNTTNNNTPSPNPTPTLVTLPGASGTVTKIAAGADHTLVLTASGQLYAFGWNFFGELGGATNIGNLAPNPTPALINLPASGGVVQIAAGLGHTLVLTSSGRLFTFGDNLYGELGSATNSGTTNSNPAPAPVDLPAETTLDAVAPGSSALHTLVVIADLAVTTDSLPRGLVGADYNAIAKAGGGSAPYAWHASGLPGGLAIDPASGQISGTPTAAGTSHVLLSVSDRFGIVAQSAPLALKVAALPVISRLRQSHRRWRKGHGPARVSALAARRKRKAPPLGTTFSFKMNESAKVTFKFTRRRGRHRVNVGKLTFAGHTGRNRVRFQGRLARHRKLHPGRYKLTATASVEGLRSKPKSLRFTIVR